MNNSEAMKLAVKLAEPFDASTFSRMSGQSESDAAVTLNGLVGAGWLMSVSPAGAGGLGGTYGVTSNGRSAAT